MRYTKMVLFLLLCALLPEAAFAGQSLVLPVGGGAANSSVPAQTGDCRVEGLLQNWGSTVDNSSLFGNPCGANITYCLGCATGGALQVYWVQGNAGTGPCVGAPYIVPLAGYSPQALYLRYQSSVAGNSAAGFGARTNSVEIWNSSGARVYNATCTYTTLVGTPSGGAAVGPSYASVSSTIGFYRVYNTLVPMGSKMPTTAPSGAAFTGGCIFHWKFDNSLADACGKYPASLTNTPCGSLSCYTSTGTIQNLVVSSPRMLKAPSWSNWISMRAGYPNQLDGTQSFSQTDGTDAVSYSWRHVSGPSALIYSSTLVGQPIVSGAVFGSYDERLLVTDAGSNTATMDLIVGAVAYDTNGVVIPADPNAGKIFGPQVAFGQNPWGWEDERNLYAINAQPAYWAAHYDYTWTTPGQGTISYPFAGKGFSPGPSCTTLSGNILATDTSISVTNASCLSLSSLPTWILIGNYANGSGSLELVRICSTTATTGAATLTVCYDGRGVSGNSNNIGSVGWVGATAWSSGTNVGEFRIQGSGTLFASDANRPICPAGVPGPPGAVAYSTGTVTLTGGSTTVTGSGTTWTNGNGVSVNGFIRVAATHGGGTSFVYWAQITAINSNTSITVSRPPPTDVDGTAFSYKITSPAMYLSLEFTAADGHVARGLFNGVGCESETAMFAAVYHDVSGLDATVMSGVKYSYKGFLSLYSSGGLYTPDFYGTGLAARNFYYRSGYGPALAFANSVDEYATRDPEIADGIAPIGGQPLVFGGMVLGAMTDLILNSSTVLTWPNVEQFARNGEIGSGACNAWDTRDSGYLTAWLTFAADWDTNATNQAAFITALKAVLARDQGCKRNASDGYVGAEVNSFANSFVFVPSASPLTLTNGSTAVTGTGFTPSYCSGVDTGTITVKNGSSIATVASGTLAAQSLIYIYDSTTPYLGVFLYSGTTRVQLAGVWPGASGTFSFMSASSFNYYGIWTSNADNVTNNQALEKAWACKYNSSTSLTLNRPWDAASGAAYYISNYNIGTFGQQPFFFGVKTNQANWASKSSDPTISAGYAAILPLMGEWYNSYGYDAVNNHGTFYFSIFQACAPPTLVAVGNFGTIHGGSCDGAGIGGASGERVDSAEGGSAMIQFYLANPTLQTKAIVDQFYGAIFGYVPYCASSVLSTCDGTTASQLDNVSLSTIGKWSGFFFGMGGFFSNSWPAVRNGIQPASMRTVYVGLDMGTAASARITVTAPSGAVSAVSCSATPCAITVDDRQGSHWYEVQHLSGTGQVLATAAPVLLPLAPQR